MAGRTANEGRCDVLSDFDDVLGIVASSRTYKDDGGVPVGFFDLPKTPLLQCRSLSRIRLVSPNDMYFSDTCDSDDFVAAYDVAPLSVGGDELRRQIRLGQIDEDAPELIWLGLQREKNVMKGQRPPQLFFAPTNSQGFAKIMSIFAIAVDALFADPNLARTALYRPGGIGDGAPVRVIAKRNDQVSEFSDISVVSATARFDLRVSEIANPTEGDTITLDCETFVVQGEPLRDTERLVWTLDTRPA